MSQYEYTKAYRKRYPEKRRAEKKRYYDKTANAENGGTRWNEDMIKLIIEHNFTDTELSEILGKSVNAIQKKRWEVKRAISRRQWELY